MTGAREGGESAAAPAGAAEEAGETARTAPADAAGPAAPVYGYGPSLSWRAVYAAAPAAPEKKAPAAAAPKEVAAVSLWEHAVFDMNLVTPKHKYVTGELRNAHRKKADFEKQLASGHLYLYHIVNELKRRDMPLELAMIPIIESNFDPHASNRNGTKGIWQFVPVTARNFKLRHDATYDMRKDVIASTDAALNYFSYLYGMFKDWNLAIAAYNVGEGTVLRAVKANRRRGRSTDLWSLPMARAGVKYVERLHAYADLVRNAERNNLKFPDLPYMPVFKKVRITRSTTLASLSRETGVSVERLQKLNPGFLSPRRSTTLVDYALVPIDHLDLPENYSLAKMKNLCPGDCARRLLAE